MADSLHRATDLVLEALEELLEAAGTEVDPETTPEPMIVVSDRWNADDFAKAVEQATNQKPEMNEPGVLHATWLN